MKLHFPLALAIVLLTAAAQAQRPPGPPGRPVEAAPAILNPVDACVIEGRVVKFGTGEPLKKARVTLLREGPRSQPVLVLTNAEGKFTINDLLPGRYRLNVTRNGFVRQEYGQPRAGRPGTALNLSAGQKISDLLFRLLPAGVITGHVYDEDGDPAPNVMVTVLRQRYVRGQKQWAPAESSQSNDLGEFRIAGLAPGKFFLSATYPQGMAIQFSGGSPQVLPGRDGSAEEETYAPTFYPGTNDIEQARAIDIAAGEEIRGIDLTLRPVRAVRIRGRVVNTFASGSRVNVTVMLTQRGFTGRMAMPRSALASESQQGQFELRGVTPGSYILSAMWNESGKMFFAREALEVGSVSLENVELTLAPAIEITGRVRMEGSQETRFPGMRVSLLPRDDTSAGGGGASVSPTGTFTITNVMPDAYRMMVSGGPEDAYLKSVRLGNEEVLETGFQLARVPSTNMEIVLSPHGASVSGFVRDAQMLPVSGATVVLVPENAKRRNTVLYRTAITDPLGQFTLRGIPPGSYKLFAWDDVDNGAWFDPEFLAPFEQKGESIKLDESARATVELKVIANAP